MSSLSPAAGIAHAGRLFALFLDVARLSVRRPFQGREFVQQAWFIASVTILPTALVAIPFGAVIALQLGTLTRQLGAQSFTGAASVLAVIREASPIVCALLISGAGGAAIAAHPAGGDSVRAVCRDAGAGAGRHRRELLRARRPFAAGSTRRRADRRCIDWSRPHVVGFSDSPNRQGLG